MHALLRRAGAATALVAAIAAAPAAAQDERAIVDQLVISMRLHEVIEEWPPQIVESVVESPGWKSLPPQQRDRLLALLRESFRPHRLFARLNDSLLADFDRGRYTAFIAATKKPLAREMQDVELREGKTLGSGTLAKFQAGLKDQPPDKARLQLVAELDRLTRASETLAAIGASSIMAAAVAADPRVAGPDFKSNLEKVRAKLEQGSRNHVQLTFLYLYRTVPDKTLREYVNLLRTPAFANMVPTLNKAISAALIGALGEFFDGARRLGRSSAT